MTQIPAVVVDTRPGSSRLVDRAARWLPVALFAAVPLVVSPAFADQYTTVKWYLLQSLGIAWFLAEAGCGGIRWPGVLRGRLVEGCLALAAGLSLAGALRSGAAYAAGPLIDRVTFLLIVLAAHASFRRHPRTLEFMTRACAVSLVVVLGGGLSQLLGFDPFATLTAGDGRSSTFGNANLAAQFVGVALALLVATGTPGSERRARVLREGLVVVGLVYLWFLACRSVWLGLTLVAIVLLNGGRLRPVALGRMLASAIVGVLLLHTASSFGLRLEHPSRAERSAAKAASAQMRLAVWEASLRLVADRPLGVGAGNFADAFIPYQLGLHRVVDPSIQFLSPHNEGLRLVVEEGIGVTLLVGLVVVVLVRGVWRARRTVPPRSAVLAAGWALLAVELAFQFPLTTAFGALACAVWLGLSLAVAEPSAPPAEPRFSPRVGNLGAAALGVLCLLGVARTVAAEVLSTHWRMNAAVQDLACRLQARGLPACVTAAWLHAREGRPDLGRDRLLQVLERSPHYHPAIRLLGEEAAARGDVGEACLALWIYDQLHRGRSPVHGRLGRLCGDRAPIPPGVTPMPYYRVFPVPAKPHATVWPDLNAAGMPLGGRTAAEVASEPAPRSGMPDAPRERPASSSGRRAPPRPRPRVAALWRALPGGWAAPRRRSRRGREVEGVQTGKASRVGRRSRPWPP